LAQLQHNKLFWFVSISAFLFPALALVVKQSDGVIYVLLSLVGLWYAAFRRKSITLEKDEKLLIFAIGFFFVAAVVAVIFSEDPARGIHKLSKYFRFLLVIPTYFLFRKVKIPESVFWNGVTCGAIFSGLMAIFEATVGPVYQFRWDQVAGATHPILFGDLALTMGVISMLGIRFYRSILPRLIVLPIAGLLLGLVASFLSGSRGSWVALPILLALLIWFIRSALPRTTVIVIGVLLLVLPIVSYVTPGLHVAKRVDDAIEQLSKYSNSTIDSPVRETSVGTRLEMWQAALTIFKQHPVLGVGWGGYKPNASKLVKQGKRNPSAAAWGHPHNEYFSVMASSGTIGLVALLMLFFVPMRNFIFAIKSGSDSARVLGMAGVILVVGYMNFALTEAIFERDLPIGFYAFFVALITALIACRYELDFENCPRRKQSLSVTIIAMDEADRIERALKSVTGWADEIIVLDSGSKDNTVEICKRYTDKVFETDWPGYGPQKQRALEKASCDWVFSLDADEELSPELRCDIDRALNESPLYDAYRTPWAVITFGKRLDFGRSARAPKRLFRREGARFSDAQVHERVIMPKERNKVGKLRGRLIHYTHRDFGHYLQKSARYAWLGGQRRYQDNVLGGGLFIALLRAIWNFVLIYFIRLGILDGRVGFLVAVMYAQAAFNKYASLWSIRRVERLQKQHKPRI